ncbi:MAG: hypothetical protein U0791_21770 [Gemmataceae bacterium]
MIAAASGRVEGIPEAVAIVTGGSDLRVVPDPRDAREPSPGVVNIAGF